MENKDFEGFSVCHLVATEKFAAIDNVIDNCKIFDELNDNKERFRRAVHRREIIETTGIGHGVAIAHGKLPCIDKVCVGLGVSEDGIDYNSKDGQPVHLLFVISSSPFTQINYLKTLAKILKSVHDEELRNEVARLFCKDFHGEVCEDFLHMLGNQKF
ncbi:MAG: PTS sugar transporter subunit IIA [Spirochaetaceae bacterium]|nr:PTS sugar transporter subunit IIA [Spirochaetaceae bacterium]